MNNYHVLLVDGTVGMIRAEFEPEEGTIVTVSLDDENGNPITRTGEVSVVLEVED